MLGIGAVCGFAKANGLEYFFCLAGGKGVTVGELAAKAGGAVSVPLASTVPAQVGVGAFPPVIVPAIIRGDVAPLRLAR